MLQVGGREIQVQFTLVSIGDATRFLAHDDGNGVSSLGDTLGRTVTQAQVSRDVGVMGNGKDTTSTHEFAAIDNQGTIMQGAILEKNILNQP